MNHIASLYESRQNADGSDDEDHMSIATLLLIFLFLVLIGVLPTWPHSREWGYYPSGGTGILLIIILLLVLNGRI